MCRHICDYVAENICQEVWQLATRHLSDEDVRFLNCTQPEATFGPVPHCCSDAGIRISKCLFLSS